MVGRIIEFNKPTQSRYDYMNRGLQRRVRMIVKAEYNAPTVMQDELSQYIINCFDKYGLVETFNELGWRSWKKMVIDYIREVEKEEQCAWN